MRRTLLAALAALYALGSSTAAFAHVIVSPGEVTAGSSVTFEMRVPTEGIDPTTSVRLLRPFFFQRFYFRARVPNAPATLVWKVTQTYRGGKVVHYTGDPGEESAS